MWIQTSLHATSRSLILTFAKWKVDFILINVLFYLYVLSDGICPFVNAFQIRQPQRSLANVMSSTRSEYPRTFAKNFEMIPNFLDFPASFIMLVDAGGER